MQNERNLTRRYLVWCYKTTKEELDKIDRYFTQLDVDVSILKQLRNTQDYRNANDSKEYKVLVDQFQTYMRKKEGNVIKQKFKNADRVELNPEYQYLFHRFAAIEQAIIEFLGKKELDNICDLYEQEMTHRILLAREHT